MKLYAVTVYVEAEDAVCALQAAGDLLITDDAAQLAALEDGIVIRPATKAERARQGVAA